MDKLKPLIVHKFWVLLGLAVLLPVIGWWLLSGNLQAEIESRRTKLAKAETDAKSGGDAPNPGWTTALGQINDVHKEKYLSAAYRLYLDQKELTVWPRFMESKDRTFLNSEGVHFVDLPYRTPVEDSLPKEVYQEFYPDEWERVVLEVDPVHEGKGTIKVTPSTIHRPAMPVYGGGQAPTWPQVFSAQEDLWLLSGLFESLRNVNAGSKRITESPLRELISLKLMGGFREGVDDEELIAANESASAAESATSSGGGDYGGSDYGGSDYGGEDYGGDYGEDEGGDYGGDYGGGGGPSASVAGFDFGVIEEFGEAKLPGGGSALSPGASREKRYVDCDPNIPYKTRGFQMQVVLLQDSVPSFIAELSSSIWPVEIVRVHQKELNADVVTSSGGASGYGGGGDYGGEDYGGGGDDYGGGEDYGADGGDYGGGGDDYGYGGGAAGSAVSAGFLQLTKEDQDLVASALLDRNLVVLNVAGLITLFRSQEEQEIVSSGAQSPDVVAEEADSEGGSTPPPTAPATDGSPSTDDAANDETDEAATGDAVSDANAGSEGDPAVDESAAEPVNP